MSSATTGVKPAWPCCPGFTMGVTSPVRKLNGATFLLGAPGLTMIGLLGGGWKNLMVTCQYTGSLPGAESACALKPKISAAAGIRNGVSSELNGLGLNGERVVIPGNTW